MFFSKSSKSPWHQIVQCAKVLQDKNAVVKKAWGDLS